MSDVDPVRRAARRRAVEEMLSTHSDLFAFNDEETERDPGESEAALTGWVLLVRNITVDEASNDHNEHLLILGNEGLGYSSRRGILEWAVDAERTD